MIADLCSRITTEQRKTLSVYDIDSARITRFAKGERLPSAAQLVTICAVLGVDPMPYLVALSEQTATPAQRRLFSSGALKLAAVLVAVAELCSPPPAQARSTTCSTVRTGFDNLDAKHHINARQSALRSLTRTAYACMAMNQTAHLSAIGTRTYQDCSGAPA